MTELIIDECLHSNKLIKALKNSGLDFKFLGTGVQDSDIISYMWRNPQSILVTEDAELNEHFTWDRSLLLSTKDPLNDKIRVIKAFMEGHDQTKTS